MRPRPYLRAYMAGIVVPTLLLLVAMTVYACFRFYFEVPSQFVLEMPAWPLARAIVFPLAVVPNAWGLWNMLYLAVRSRLRLPLGLHGALLPLFLIPGGVAILSLHQFFDALAVAAAGNQQGIEGARRFERFVDGMDSSEAVHRLRKLRVNRARRRIRECGRART